MEQAAGNVRQASGEAKNATVDLVRSSISETGRLPNQAGQIWREYDIRPYTRQVADRENPQQEIIDWILRETGTDMWFREPLGILNATPEVVRVYQTPEVHETVAATIERFVNRRSEEFEVAVRLVTVGSADWRVKAAPILKPVQTQTPGIEAWVLPRENATLLYTELSRRSDFREHNTPNLAIYSGKSHKISNYRPRTFTSGAYADSSQAGYGNVSQLNEGYSLEISPLASRDGNSMEAVVKCNVEQVERLTPLYVNAPNNFGTLQRVQIQVPQISGWRLHERFTWPMDQVLLVSRGLVAAPGPTGGWNGSFAKLFEGGAPRADVLLFLDCRPELSSATRGPTATADTAKAEQYRGRY